MIPERYVDEAWQLRYPKYPSRVCPPFLAHGSRRLRTVVFVVRRVFVCRPESTR